MTHVMACTGMTWDAVLSEIDLPRLQALNRYWLQHPPIHILVAKYLGYSPQAKAPASIQPPSEEEFTQLLETFPTAPAPVYMSAEEYKKKRSEVIPDE